MLTPLLFLLALSSPSPADLVLRGGTVYTVDSARSWAQAVAVKGGTIVFVGTDLGAAPWIGPQTKVVDLHGELVLPGFEDAHNHALAGGIALGQCDLHDLPTRDGILQRVVECARARPSDPFLQGSGWLMSAFPNGLPTRQDLDRAVPGRAIYLESSDGHSAWVSSTGLARAHIDAKTPDPPNGRIDRDAAGVPSGTLQEEAMALVSSRLPEPSPEECRAGLARALEILNRNGITAVQMPIAPAFPPAPARSLETLRSAEGRGALSAKFVVALGTDPLKGPEQIDDLVRLRGEFTSPRVRPTAVKIFADGIIEAHTAAMLAPYADRPGEAGRPIWSKQALDAIVARLASQGFSAHIHAIGDRAIRISLDAIEGAGRGPARLRHQIAHVQVVDPADVPRFVRIGVIANFQPLWAFPDPYIKELTTPLLGPERMGYLYPIGSILRSGAVVAFGSDWDVSSLNPLEGIQVAVTRQDPKNPGEALLAAEAISLPEAVAAYTIGAAYANGLEEETGSIEPGKAADMVVLSADLFRIPVHTIARTKVLLTLLDGVPVFRDPTFPLP
jgi:predicted amidohydrolase YtcJ